jgi:phosphoribosyl 1,2-cyclic phosphate 1,2-diphosphodiesterase
MMLGDLHVHTTRSDGSYSPEEAVREAKRRGLSYLGITDHDTTEGLGEAVALGEELGVAVIPGVEVSAYDYARKRKAHLLGYRYSTPAASIEKLCGPISTARDELTRRQIATLAASGFPISVEDAIAAAGGTSGGDPRLYKQHVMAALTAKGAADGVRGKVYRELFGPGGLCHEEIAYADAFEALRAIHEDGGIAVLAHPGQFDSWELLEELLEAGLDGIELYHETHSLVDHRKVLGAARSRPGILLTGGSDDHGSFGSTNPMGDIRAPFGSFEALAQAQEARSPCPTRAPDAILAPISWNDSRNETIPKQSALTMPKQA